MRSSVVRHQRSLDRTGGLNKGGENDIVCISANGFPVATGEDFLALLQAVGASGPNAPKPTALDTFLANHPAAATFLARPRPRR